MKNSLRGISINLDELFDGGQEFTIFIRGFSQKSFRARVKFEERPTIKTITDLIDQSFASYQEKINE